MFDLDQTPVSIWARFKLICRFRPINLLFYNIACFCFVFVINILQKCYNKLYYLTNCPAKRSAPKTNLRFHFSANEYVRDVINSENINKYKNDVAIHTGRFEIAARGDWGALLNAQ